MTWGPEIVVAVVALVLLGVAVAAVSQMVTERMEQRRALIREARGLFERHFAAVNRLLDDAATPEVVKAFAADFSVVINDPRAAAEVSRVLTAEKPATRRTIPQVEATMRELEGLIKHREDLFRSFEEAVMTGMLAVTLREAALNSEISAALHMALTLPDQRRRSGPRDIINQALSGLPNGYAMAA